MTDFTQSLSARGIPTVTPYLGQIATAVAHHTSKVPANIAYNSRTGHTMRDAVISFQIAFSNYQAASETGPGAALTVEAAIEYPAGTFTRVVWSGGNVCTIADGADGALSDPIALAIPRGAKFWVRSFHQCTAGALILALTGAGASVDGTGAEWSTTPGALASKVMGGTIATSGTGSLTLSIPPYAIVGMTNRISVGIVGDSIAAGVYDKPEIANDTGIIARKIGPVFAYMKLCMSGEALSNFIGVNGAKRRARLQYCSHIISNHGRNGLGAGAAAVAADHTTLADMFPTKPLFNCTILPGTTSTDVWTTLENQTVMASEAQRLVYNRNSRGGLIPGVAGCFDLANVLENAYDGGKWPAGYIITADSAGVHPTTAAYQAVVQSAALDVSRLQMAVPG